VSELSFGELEPTFADLCVRLITECANHGILLMPYSANRSPTEQAKLWRQGRSLAEIESAARRLKDAGAPYLASCLLTVGPQRGAKVTNALPGESWHNWGEGLDFFVLDENDQPIHDGSHPKYIEMGAHAEEVGLHAGVFWPKPDAGHVQLRSQPVKSFYEWPDINRLMREKYEH
jgi:hypothetical protein